MLKFHITYMKFKHYTLREDQVKLFNFTVDSLKENKKFIIIDAPPGIGKSIYAMSFIDWYHKNYDSMATFDMLTDSKILQEQYTKEFPEINSLWSKQSYTCEEHNTDCGTGTDWCKLQGSECAFCPYKIAKYNFENGMISLTNYHLFFTYRVLVPEMWKRTSRVLIIDEGHKFENVLGDFVSLKLNKNILSRNGLTEFEIAEITPYIKNYEDDLDEFVDNMKKYVLPIMTNAAKLLKSAATIDIKMLNKYNSLTNLISKFNNIIQEYNKNKENWTITHDTIKKYNKNKQLTDNYDEVTIEAVWGTDYLNEYIYSKYDTIIMMSATFLNKELTCSINGIDPNKASYISLNSPFPVENRPIYFFSQLGKQTYKTKDMVFKNQLPVLEKIIKKHKTEKGIIHSGSYELQKWVMEQSSTKFYERLIAPETENRMALLNQHINSEEPTVLISPSMSEGVDLKEDLSRHQTIIKIPYPNLSSKKVKKRMDTNKEWYGYATVQTIIQAYGRSIRSDEDYAATYILDGCFADLIKWNRKFFPKWVLSAVETVD